LHCQFWNVLKVARRIVEVQIGGVGHRDQGRPWPKVI
jgi:hypothetical protein